MFHVKHSAFSERQQMPNKIQTALPMQQQENDGHGNDKSQNRHYQRKAHPAELGAQGVVFALKIPKIPVRQAFFLLRRGVFPTGQGDHCVGIDGVLLHYCQTFVAKYLGRTQFFAAFHASHSVHLLEAIVYLIIHHICGTVKRKML